MLKVAILIDGSNLFHGLSRKNLRMNYEKLKEFLLKEVGENEYTLTYYGSRPAKTPKSQLGFLFYLQNLGYSLKINILKERMKGRFIEKGVDASIVDDLNSIIHENHSPDCIIKINKVIVVSGDKDYLGTLEKLKREKISICLVGFESSTSTDLRLLADKFISLDKQEENLCEKKPEKEN